MDAIWFFAMRIDSPEATPTTMALLEVTLQNAGKSVSIFQADVVGEMVRIDGGIGSRDIAQNRSIIARNEVRQVGPQFAPGPADLVTFVATNLFTKENLLSMQPMATCQFRERTVLAPTLFVAPVAHGRRMRP